MRTPRFQFDKLVTLLRRSQNDPAVRSFFGPAISNIERDEYYGTLEFKSEGVDVVFQEAPWVVPSHEITDPKELYLAAFHLHSNGHEGYEGYSDQLPNGLAFGDFESEVIRKMGHPLKIGGGSRTHLLKEVVPRWFWYPLGEAILHVQLDPNGAVEMVTPMVRPQ